MFSLGVTLFFLLMGYPPFQGASEAELMDHTVNRPVQYIAEDWAELSADALLLVKNMLAKNPEQRPSMEEVLAFDWVKHPPSVRHGGGAEAQERRSLAPSRSGRQIFSSDFSFPTTLPGSSLSYA